MDVRLAGMHASVAVVCSSLHRCVLVVVVTCAELRAPHKVVTVAAGGSFPLAAPAARVY